MPKKGYKMTEAHKLAIANGLKGRVCSEETKRKISESQKGEKGYWFGKNKPPVSDETKAKMTLAQDKKKTPEIN